MSLKKKLSAVFRNPFYSHPDFDKKDYINEEKNDNYILEEVNVPNFEIKSLTAVVTPLLPLGDGTCNDWRDLK